MKGKFIVFEGCEGVGKSTQIRLLKEYLEKSGQEAVFTREPGGTPFAEEVRNIILTSEMGAESEALLFAAARCDHIDKLILPALNAGKIVICDRYVHSSLAYQAYARKLGRARVENINAYAMENCMPDGVIFIDMNPLESWRRQKGKTVLNDRMERESDEFHSEVYRGFCELGKSDETFINIVPDVDKALTSQKIIRALIERGLIR